MERERTWNGFRAGIRLAAFLLLCAVAAWTQPAEDPQPVQVERITLTSRGFEPAVRQRPPGRVLLALDNRTGLPQVVLRLESASGPPLERRFARGRVKWREFLTLAPGEYVIREATHPAWVCRIAVTAR